MLMQRTDIKLIRLCIGHTGFTQGIFICHNPRRLYHRKVGENLYNLCPYFIQKFSERRIMGCGSPVVRVSDHGREKVNSLIPFKIFDEWSNYLIGWRSRVSVTFDRVIGSRQGGGDFRYDEYKKQDDRSCNHASLPPPKNLSGPSHQSRPTHIRPHLQNSIWDGGTLRVPFPSDDSDSVDSLLLISL
ncbi:hypothetical protein TNCV_2742551 [Trichonephila clavipes]|nr:hypothetical protein TNCV_2742551 [Trichonephila clavipes]